MPKTLPCRLPVCAAIISLVALLSACAGAAVDRAGAHLDDPDLHRYVQQLACELAAPCEDLRIVLVDAPQQQAELLPDGRLSLRLGMLLAIEEDCELAFVLAHEIAHRQFQHRATPGIDGRLPMELAADAAALTATTALGFPPDCGARLIQRLQPVALDEATRAAGRKQLQARLQALPAATSRRPEASVEWTALMARHRQAAAR